MKYYCLFAVEKQNQKNVVGCVETHGTLMWSRERVTIWAACSDEEYEKRHGSAPYAGISAKARWKQFGRFPNGTRRGYMRKFWTTRGKKEYSPKGRTYNEYAWNELKQIAEYRCKRECKNAEAFDFVVCRVNSKWCPAVVDFSERIDMQKKKIKMTRDYYSPKFTVK